MGRREFDQKVQGSLITPRFKAKAIARKKGWFCCCERVVVGDVSGKEERRASSLLNKEEGVLPSKRQRVKG